MGGDVGCASMVFGNMNGGIMEVIILFSIA